MEFGIAFKGEIDPKRTVAIARQIEAAGFDYVWFVEHHFLTTFSSSPCPEVIFGALSRLTKRIRLGFGVVILPYHHPVRVAERVAMVDQLSHGRVDFGTGRSAPYEQTGMGIDPRYTRDMWEESLTMIPKIWESDTFEWQGQFWNVPPREVLPKPYQKPHPPMWVAVTSPGTELDAADRGIGCLGVTFTSFAEQEAKVKEYRRRVQNCDPVGSFVNDQVATVNFLYCHQDNEVGAKTGMGMIRHFNYMAAQLDMAKEAYPVCFPAPKCLE